MSLINNHHCLPQIDLPLKQKLKILKGKEGVKSHTKRTFTGVKERFLKDNQEAQMTFIDYFQ